MGKVIEIDAATLMGRKLRTTRFVVPNLIPTGLTILAARPKSGKSYLALDLALSVSGGWPFLGIPAIQGGVLYLALEDTLRRLQARINHLAVGREVSPELHFNLGPWSRLDQGGLEFLDTTLGQSRRTRLAVIDTFGRVAPAKGGGGYQGEYKTLAGLKAVADRRNVALLLVHHLRKCSAANWSDEIQGSSAVAGAADALLHLSRPRNDGDAILNVTGRDIEERQIGLRFDDGRWSIVNLAPEEFASPERRRVIDFLAEAAGPLGPKAVADGLGTNHHSTRRIMSLMRRDGLLERVVGGYVPARSGDHRSERSPRSPSDQADNAASSSLADGETDSTGRIIPFVLPGRLPSPPPTYPAC